MAIILTYGCKVNQYESQLIRENIELNGNFKEDNIVIINTCCVTDKIEKEIKKKIRKLLKEGKKIYITGCLVKKNSQLIENTENIIIVDKSFFIANKDKIERFEGHTRCFVKIEDGCDNFCSYCIIPFVRGKVRSRFERDIIEEVNKLVDNGYKEVVLTGINLGCYGKDTGENLISLIENLSKIENLKRIRLSSIEIYYIDENLIDFLKNVEKFCPHFHIPLQSGSDRILKLMGRRYTLSEFIEKLDMIKNKIEKVTFTTDIIVGFPGEKDEDFEMSCYAIEKIGFLKVHVFPYSEREGTKAIYLPEKIKEEIKKERIKRILKVSNMVSKKVKERFIGKKCKILFEKEKNRWWEGYSENYIPFKVKSEKNLKNEILEVIPEKIYREFLIGKIV